MLLIIKSLPHFYLQLGLEAVIELLRRYEYRQTHQTGDEITHIGVPEIAQQAIPRLKQSEPALRTWDLQAQQVLDLRRQDGEGGSCSEAAEEGVRQVDGHKAHLQKAH